MSTFTSLLGLDRNTAGMGAYQQAGNALNSLKSNAATYGNLAGSAGADYSHFNPEYTGAVDDYANYLRTNPYDATRNNADLNMATAAGTNAYRTAGANIQAHDAQIGVNPGSSLYEGQMQANELGHAGSMAYAANTLAQNRIAQEAARKQQLVSLLGNSANNAFGQQTQALGASTGAYGNIANEEMQIGGAQHQAQAQANQGLFGALGGVAGLVGNYYGMKTNPYGSGGGSSDVGNFGTMPDPYSYLYGGSQQNPVPTNQYATGTVGPFNTGGF